MSLAISGLRIKRDSCCSLPPSGRRLLGQTQQDGCSLEGGVFFLPLLTFALRIRRGEGIGSGEMESAQGIETDQIAHLHRRSQCLTVGGGGGTALCRNGMLGGPRATRLQRVCCHDDHCGSRFGV